MSISWRNPTVIKRSYDLKAFLNTIHVEVELRNKYFPHCVINIEFPNWTAELEALELAHRLSKLETKLEEVESSSKAFFSFENYLEDRVDFEKGNHINDCSNRKINENEEKKQDKSEEFKNDYKRMIEVPLQIIVIFSGKIKNEAILKFMKNELLRNRIFHLNISNAIYSRDIIEAIISACKSRSLSLPLELSFSIISDQHAAELFELLPQLKSLQFSGDQLSDDTIQNFARAAALNAVKGKGCNIIIDNKLFEEYKFKIEAIENISLDSIFDKRLNLTPTEINYMTSRIKQKKAGATSYRNYLETPIHLRCFSSWKANDIIDVTQSEWIDFFNTLIPKTKSKDITIMCNDKLDKRFISKEIISAIIQSLAYTNSITIVFIRYPLTSEQIKQLAEVLSKKTIDSLTVESNLADTESFCELINAIKKNNFSKIKILSLTGGESFTQNLNKVDEVIGELLIQKKTLMELSLSLLEGNRAIFPVREIAKSLKINNTLSWLSLYRNFKIDSAGLILLGKNLQNNNSLKNLYLETSALIPDTAVNLFLFGLQVNKSLLRICLNEDIPSNAIEQLSSNFRAALRDVEDRNRNVLKSDRLNELDEYFICASVLFQGHRSSFQCLNNDMLFHILRMLAPKYIVNIKLSQATELIQANIESRKWLTRGEYCTFFKHWEAPDQSLAAASRASRLGLFI